jgi:hypothetical protein
MTARRRPPAHAPEETPVEQLAPPAPEPTATTPRRPNRTGQRPRAPQRTTAARRPRQPEASTADAPAHEPEAATAHSVTGVVGDASATVAAATRSGEDVRRRGWFWHWNSIVTQYAPLIGLKGVGLLNSYTVWTDRREESPHRGYAFPSQQKEADFYGEERAELITINKILVALDLIEIRKEMVLRTDERGRRWRVPHNFYRVKDHGDGFTLNSDAVHAVVVLADRDRAVYRYVRRIFSPRFAPIDPANVWGTILTDLRDTEVWQRLATRTARDEDRASARSRAGHASRRVASGADPAFLLPSEGDTRTPEPTPRDSTNDSHTVETTTVDETSVAETNTGFDVDVAECNTGLAAEGQSSVAPVSNGAPTSVAPSNRTYHQEETTTTTGANDIESDPTIPTSGPGKTRPPDDTRDEATALIRFEEANARPATPAERRLLRDLARTFTPAAAANAANGWVWLGAAIDDAVAAGSAFVAPRRLREILSRWEREGPPPEVGGDAAPLSEQPKRGAGHGRGRDSARPRLTASAGNTAVGVSRPSRQLTERGEDPAAEPAMVTASFVVAECGLSNRQVWSAILDELRTGGDSASVDTWLRDAMILGRGEDGALVVGVPHELARRRVADRFVTPLRRAVTAVVGVALPIEVVLTRDWFAGQGGQAGRQSGDNVAKRSG